MDQIVISQNENQNISINSNNPQLIRVNNLSTQDVNINQNENQDLEINQAENQVIMITGSGSIIGITDVLVNGISVVSGTTAYVIVPTKTSELINDSNFITSETDPTVPSYVKEISLADINNWNNKQNALVSGNTIKTINNESILGSGNIEITGNVYTSGTGINIDSNNVINNIITSYNDLADLPTIPSMTSELINDSDFVSEDDLAEVAFTGSYNSLSDTPVIPDSTSDLINDSNFTTSSEVSTEIQTAISTKQDTLVSGTNIKTINNNSLLGSGNINISGGTPTDVQINGTSIVSNNTANIITESAYNSSTNKIATKNDIPTTTSELTNDSGYIDNTVNDLTNYTLSSNLSSVATSGDYNDLTNKPTIINLPTGSILPFAGNTAPNGYLICDGSPVSRTTYADLFNIIGTTYGNGDGSTTFNLPNLKGKVLTGYDSTDSDFNSLGKIGGSKYIQEHKHLGLKWATQYGNNINFNNGSGGVLLSPNWTDGDNSSSPIWSGDVGNVSTGNSGNLSPYIVVQYIIKT